MATYTTYYCADARPAAGIPGEVHATKLNDVGAERVFLVDGKPMTFIYLAGVASCIAGSTVVYQEGTWTAVLVATGLKGSVAVASAAITNGNWGWFLIVGTDVITVRTAVTSNVALFIGGVAGYVDVAAVKGDQIQRMFCRNAAASGGGSAQIQINRATVGMSNESAG